MVVATAISDGLKNQYSEILRHCPELYVTGDNFGSNAPIELAQAERFKDIPGVVKVVPRVIGRTYEQGKFVAILGIDSAEVTRSIQVIEGRLPVSTSEVILGWRAARSFNAKLGSEFSLKGNPEQVFCLVGLLSSPFTVWESDLMVMSFEAASDLFGMQGKATDLAIFTRPGYEQIVDLVIRASDQETGRHKAPLRVQTRELIGRYSLRGFNIKAGVFAGFYSIVLGLGIFCIALISGFGFEERRKEISLIRALGWQTQEVMEMIAMQNLVLSLVSVPLVVLVAGIWIHVLNGVGIAKYFIANFSILVPFPVPSKMFPVPFVLSVTLALVLTMVGSIYSTWRVAIVPPAEALKA